METNMNDISTAETGLEISPKLRSDLSEAAVWGRVIAILALCSSALSLIVSFKRGMVIFSIISAAISVFVYLYLLKFGSQTKKGLETNDQQLLNDGLRNLNTYYRILGVILIIVIIICVLAFVFLALGAMIKF
jgi:ABC-type branched-subunit amino acid transport system permease subunit